MDMTQEIDDIKETMSQFMEKIATAQANGDRWVETSPEIIKILRPKGLGNLYNDPKLPIQHFCYHGVLVTEYGKSEKLDAQMDEPMTNRLHGASEAKIVSGR